MNAAPCFKNFANPSRALWIITGALAVLVALVFGPAVRYDFIGLDDNAYVYQNPQVLKGLRPEGILWAFRTIHESWWLPLLWISYMLDVTIWGTEPWGFHLTNIILHAANVILLFHLLNRLTGRLLASAFAAALFGIHPLRLESVIWITERKDVLSGLFFFLGLLAYVRHQPARMEYVFVCLVLGLMSKSVLVVFPILLVLLDYWPLRRMNKAQDLLPLVRQKAPLFVVAVAFAAITWITHLSGRGRYTTLSPLERLGLIPRNYVAYLAKSFWPTKLAIIYPENDMVQWDRTLLSLLLLGLITAVCALNRRKYPSLLMGWLWFLIALSPVIRGVRMGLASMADRFTYLPSVGLIAGLTWAYLERFGQRQRLTQILACVILAAAVGLSIANRPYWRNTETLCRRALEVTDQNYHAASCLAQWYFDQGRHEEAMQMAQEVLRLSASDPASAPARAWALTVLGRYDEAEQLYRQGLIYPEARAKLLNNLGLLAVRRGQVEQGIAHFREAARLGPTLPDVQFNLGLALITAGRPTEALAPVLRAVELNPDDHAARFVAGQLLEAAGRWSEAASHYEAAVRLRPNQPEYRAALTAIRQRMLPAIPR